jgi:CubicO group peptidase (beta-lactamase class C family)
MKIDTVHGFVDDRFASVREVFEANFTSGGDVGASFCATIDGETVVDLWGGFADEAKTQPWVKDTIINVYSTTKTMAALTVLLLADRGVLDLDAPVAKYWPEFAANGKEHIKVNHVMSHSSGGTDFGPVPMSPKLHIDLVDDTITDAGDRKKTFSTNTLALLRLAESAPRLVPRTA